MQSALPIAAASARVVVAGGLLAATSPRTGGARRAQLPAWVLRVYFGYLAYVLGYKNYMELREFARTCKVHLGASLCIRQYSPPPQREREFVQTGFSRPWRRPEDERSPLSSTMFYGIFGMKEPCSHRNDSLQDAGRDTPQDPCQPSSSVPV